MKYHPVVEICQASIVKEDIQVVSWFLQFLKPKVILEIGTWKGRSAELWYELFRPEVMITVEKNKRPDDAYEVYKDRFHYLWGHDSHDMDTMIKVQDILKDRKVDFLFIDGDHSYEGVKQDYTYYMPLVKKGGIVALHDCCCHVDRTEEVDDLWAYLKKFNNYVEIKTTESSTGLGLILV